MICPNCGSENVLIQQVQVGATSKTKTKHYSSKHGIFWWILVGWWWWFFMFFAKTLLAMMTCGVSLLFRKKKRVGDSVGKTTTTVNNKTVATCQGCGKTWNV